MPNEKRCVCPRFHRFFRPPARYFSALGRVFVWRCSGVSAMRWVAARVWGAQLRCAYMAPAHRSNAALSPSKSTPATPVTTSPTTATIVLFLIESVVARSSRTYRMSSAVS